MVVEYVSEGCTGVECDTARHTVDWCLAAQLFEHFGSTSKPVSRLSDRDVEDELFDAELPHGVGTLILFRLGISC